MASPPRCGVVALACAAVITGATPANKEASEACMSALLAGPNNVGSCYLSSHGILRCPSLAPPFPLLDGLAHVQQVAFGSQSACVLWQNSSLSCVGLNSDSELGIGNSSASYSSDFSLEVNLPQDVASVSANVASFCVVYKSGNASCWGDGHMLGDGYVSNVGGSKSDMGSNLPMVNVGTGRTFKQLVSAAHTNCGLLDDSQIRCWGLCYFGLCQSSYSSNYYLGFASESEMGDALPVINMGTGLTAMSLHAGAEHVCAILSPGGDVKCFGNGAFGALGWDSQLSTDMNAGFLGDGLPFVRVDGQVVSVACGYQFTCVLLLSPAQVFCFGLNTQGQLGVGDFLNRGDGSAAPRNMANIQPVNLPGNPVAIAASHSAALTLLSSGEIFAWGGATDLGAALDSSLPVVFFGGCPTRRPTLFLATTTMVPSSTARPSSLPFIPQASLAPTLPTFAPFTTSDNATKTMGSAQAASAGGVVGIVLGALVGALVLGSLLYLGRDYLVRKPLPQITLCNFVEHVDAPKGLCVTPRHDLCFPQEHVLLVWTSPDCFRSAKVLLALYRALENNVGVVLLLPSKDAVPDWILLETLDSNLDRHAIRELELAGVCDIVDLTWRLSVILPTVPRGDLQELESLLRQAGPLGTPGVSRNAFLKARSRAVLLV